MEKNTLMRGYHLIVLLFFVFLFSTTFPLKADGARGVTDSEVKVGIIIDQTGPAAFVGIPYTEALRNYFRYINDQGGINGRNVKVLVEDDRYTIPGSIAAFKKLLYKDKVLALMFLGGTGQAMALFSQVQKEKVPVMVGSLAEKMINPFRRYIFNPGATYEDQIKVIFDYIIKDLKSKNPRIVAVYPDLEFGKTNLAAARASAASYGLKLVGETVVGLAALDTTSQVLQMKRLSPDFVILIEDVGSAISILRDSRKFAFKTNFIGFYYACDEAIITGAKKGAEGYIAAHTLSSWYDDTPGMKELRKVTLRYKPGSEKPYRSKFYTQGWQNGTIFAEGMKRAGKDLDNESFVNSLETLKNFKTGGLSAPVTYTQTSHKAGVESKFYRGDLEKGILIPITGWKRPLK
ncbi:MAG: ABC transporter substrate-binding protein [Thermodesulfobacteriota bacterium]|nr:ABC transporter substrate-binding protein [Thermodesulfobacteriota bacterium]